MSNHALIASHLRPRKHDFHGLSVGDRVCVHGEGFGDIIAMGEARYPSDDCIVVEVLRREWHRSGQVIEWTERCTRHPMHISRSTR